MRLKFIENKIIVIIILQFQIREVLEKTINNFKQSKDEQTQAGILKALRYIFKLDLHEALKTLFALEIPYSKYELKFQVNTNINLKLKKLIEIK
jgi:hypothetical protein